ncbi:MAG: T9SS type A sorting domain-containing protein [Bacteroidota bacterium]|nr:T9SS type A sorting domain-containing protein [Bacteroidota bacterium]
MKKNLYLAFLIAILSFTGITAFSQQKSKLPPPDFKVNTRVDNMGYWQRMVQLGLVPVQPVVRIPQAINTGSKVYTNKGVLIDDSPDVPVTNETNSTQSENSIYAPPVDGKLLNSNNSTPNPSNGNVNGADWYFSNTEGESWTGTEEGAGQSNSGDPTTAISLSGTWYIGYINNPGGQSVSWSTNQGATWSQIQVAPCPSGFNSLLDKNHMMIDNSSSSPYVGNLYDAWTSFGGSADNQIQVSRSITQATSWESPVTVSTAVNAGSHNQGVNIQTGPNGEVYIAWTIYDSWPSDEKAIGFCKSTDGGITYAPAIRAITNLKGIRNSGVTPNMRVNSFPSMAVDKSNGPRRGWIYIVWTNHGVPGQNTGSDIDCYMIRSTDQGNTWSTPIRINQGPSGVGKQAYLPWITCDPATGYLGVVFYDNRNTSATQVETYIATSKDGGNTWTDMKVSDVSFTPSPIPNLATGYMGDYLGITSYNSMFYPTWTDNRLGYCMTYVSPIQLIAPIANIAYSSYTLNDSIYGNNNRKMDYGEKELLGLTVKNIGTAPTDSVWVTLSSPSPYITFADSTEFYGDFIVNQSKTISNAYQFTVSDSIPDGAIIEFDVKAVDKNDSAFYSHFFIESHAPAVTITNMVVQDAAPGGNGNGRLDPGETATIQVTITNTGEYTAENAASLLTSSNPYAVITNPLYNIGNLSPNQSVTIPYNIVVNPNAAYGSATKLHDHAYSLYQQDNKEWILKIGLIIEDWETGNFNKFPWQFSGNAEWKIDSVTKWEKNYSARSGAIGDNQNTKLTIHYNVLYDDTISFYRKVSSQIFADNLVFSIDSINLGTWNGVKDWKRYAYPVLAGPHTFTWSYNKDAQGSQNDDAVWVDYIVFPPEYKTTAYAGDNSVGCAGNAFQLHGIAVAYDSLLWVTSGTGTFSDPKILDPVYTPSDQDNSAGNVNLTLHAYSQNKDTASTLQLTLVPQAIISAGNNASICAGSTYSLNNATAQNYTSLQWSTSGNGTFSDPSLINPVYTPGSQDLAADSVRLTLTAIPASSQCPTVTSQLTLIIQAIPVVSLGKDTVICSNKTYTLDATTSDAVSYQWLPDGQTTASITVDSIGVGYGTKTFIALVTNANGCVGTDTVKITWKNCLGMDELSGIEYRLFPNPNPGVFTLQISSQIREKINIRILTTLGEVVMSIPDVDVRNSYTRKIDAGTLSQGTYYLELSKGNSRKITKLIIQK